jgi:hypothetical protein
MWRIGVTVLGLLALAGEARQVSVVGQAPSADVTVPMFDFGHRPVVEVRINGQGPFRMILDTGASGTVVDPAWVGGATGLVELQEVQIGALSWKQMPVESQPLFAGPIAPDFPKGVLSAAAFPGYLVTLDYPNKTVSIRKGELPVADGRRVFQYGEAEVLPVAPVRVAGREFNLHVDSGSPGGVMLPLRFSKDLPLEAELRPVGKARTPAGEFDVFSAPVKGAVELGEYVLEVPGIRFSDLRPGPKPGPGNIGYEVLRTFKVTLDAANRRLLFER